MNKPVLIVAGLAVFLGLGVLVSSSNETSSQPSATQTPSEQTTEQPTEQQPEAENAIATKSEGRYIDYSESAIAESGYDTTILFFHAPWCPQCRAFEQDIRTKQIPDGVQILQVDFDSSTELKSKHGVTLQTTFVSVDKSGNTVKKWVGYSEEKTLERLLKEF